MSIAELLLWRELVLILWISCYSVLKVFILPWLPYDTCPQFLLVQKKGKGSGEMERKRTTSPPLFIFIYLITLPRSVIKQGCNFHWPSLGDFIPYSQMLLSTEHCPLPNPKAGNSTKYPSNILCLQCWTFCSLFIKCLCPDGIRTEMDWAHKSLRAFVTDR